VDAVRHVVELSKDSELSQSAAASLEYNQAGCKATRDQKWTLPKKFNKKPATPNSPSAALIG